MEDRSAAHRVWDRGTRWLHLGLSLGVTFQLFASLVMEVPQPGLVPRAGGVLAFRAHKGVGTALIAIVAAHWFWSVSRERGLALRHLFPWGPAGRREILSDLRNLRAGSLPAGGPGGGLAGFVHGLGFLTVTGMAVLGCFLLLLPSDGSQASLLRLAKDLHEALANFVWLYWIGHLIMVVVHEARGHRILAGIYKP